MMLVVELVDDELDIEPIHRLLELPAGLDLRDRLADGFDVVDAGAYADDRIDGLLDRMAAEHGLGVVDGAGLALAIPKPDARAAALAGENATVASTDAAVVEAMVKPRVPEATWRYWHDAAGVAAQVDKGAAGAAILCSPVSVSQTRAAALDGARMPQKTTFFTPKPLSGMVYRRLDG
jgi:hypothetical protein